MVYGSDGFLFVVKWLDDLTGPNLPFNECMGTELYRVCGLQCPGWVPIWLSDSLIDQNPECWITTADGMRRPKAGWCFGSRFLGLQDAPLREILSGCDFKRIRNRLDFWTARVLDALCEHADNRQALFLEDELGWLDAYFIDHGHFFGGPRGIESPAAATSRYLDKRIYPELSPGDWDQIQSRIAGIDGAALMEAARCLPEEWATPTALLRLERALDRLSDGALRRELRDSLLADSKDAGRVVVRKPPQRVGCGDTVLHSQVPGSGPIWSKRRFRRIAGVEG